MASSQRKQKPVLKEVPDRVIDSTKNKSYTKGKFLGKGSFARCYELIDNKTQRTYAGKVISKTMLIKKSQRDKMAQEIEIQQSIAHPNVVKMEGCFEDDDNVYILLELCTRRSLMELHKRRRALTEPEARYFTRQIVLACQYLHNKRIIHRDLKLGNLFLNEDMQVKVGDFGLAKMLDFDGNHNKTFCGTPNYIAPEMLAKRGHSYEVDIWAIGCVLYTLLVGKPPFETETYEDTYNLIKNNQYVIPPRIGKDAGALIGRLLAADPGRRPKINEILNFPFFTDGFLPEMLPTSCLTMAPKFKEVQPQQQEQHVEEEQQHQSPSTNELHLQQPPRKITQNVRGRQKEYHYLTTVKSYEELDKFRIQNHCRFNNSNKRVHQAFKTIILPCTSRRSRNKCDFELKALRSDLKSGKIHIYSNSKHNHPLKSEEKRLPYRTKTELMPDGNPPTIYRTLDNIEWAFLQTFPDYGKMHEFALTNHTHTKKRMEKRLHFRFYCYNRCKNDRCKLMLLAVKTTKQQYHVYSYGEHNHPVGNQKIKQQKIHSATGTAGDNNEQQSSSATAFVENGTEGHVRLKIRLPPTQLPCWRQPTTTQQSEQIGLSPIGKRMNGKKTSASVKMDEEEEPNLAAMFTTPSTHGRQRSTTARVLGGIPNSQENRQNSAGDDLTHPRDHSDMDVLAPMAQRASKNFMDQYTPEERYQIELSDKAGEMDARGELFSQSAMKKPPTKRATKKEKKPQEATSGSGQATESTTPKNPAEKKQPIKKRGTEPKKMSSREHVAKKIGFGLK